MWFNKPKRCPDWGEAQRHLCRADPVVGQIVERVGGCVLSPRRDRFMALCQAIFSQQVATPVAVILFERFKGLFDGAKVTPDGVLALPEEELRGAGVSRQKISYLKDLATHFAEGNLGRMRWGQMEDEEIIEALTEVRGIGRWTAEMFLIFVLNRPDVLPVDDLGLRKGVQQAYGMRQLPEKQQVLRHGELWRPWRSVATWYLWRGMPAKPE